MQKVVPTLKYILVLFLSLSQIFPAYFSMLFNGGMKSVFDGWQPTDTYTSDYAVTVEKNPDRDFVILSFADLQIEYGYVYGERGEYTERLVRNLTEKVKPDLIITAGDNVSCDAGYLKWIEILDSLGVPWAPVMGNHDGHNGNKLNEAWISWKYMHDSENCLFRAGPEGMGYGNYIINITENGKVIHTLFMMDTHSEAEDTENGVINYGPNGEIGEDHLWAQQIEWYEWAVKGIAASEGHIVESTAVMHIPVYQFGYVQDNWTKDGKLLPEYASLGYGQLGEGVCCPEGDNGFFAKAKELGSTTMMAFGHDHKNNMCVLFDGIRLNYVQKSGHGSYWNDEVNGGSVITVNSLGHAEMTHIDYSEN